MFRPSRAFAAALVSALLFSMAPSAASAEEPDTTPPWVNLYGTRGSIDTSEGPYVYDTFVDVGDDVSMVMPDLTLTACHIDTGECLEPAPVDMSGENPNDTWWRAPVQLVFPQNSTPGGWIFYTSLVTDAAGNTRPFSPVDGQTVPLKVLGDPELTGISNPVVEEHSVTPSTVYVGSDDAAFHVEARITDAGSGLRGVTAELWGRSTRFGRTLVVPMTLKSGNRNDGVWEADFNVPARTTPDSLDLSLNAEDMQVNTAGLWKQIAAEITWYPPMLAPEPKFVDPCGTSRDQVVLPTAPDSTWRIWPEWGPDIPVVPGVSTYSVPSGKKVRIQIYRTVPHSGGFTNPTVDPRTSLELVDWYHTWSTTKCTFTKGTPTISGTAQVGKTLTANPGTWSPTPTKLTYEWFRDGLSLGERGPKYVVGSDVGSRYSVKVTAFRDEYTDASKTSAQTAKIIPGRFTAGTRVCPEFG